MSKVHDFIKSVVNEKDGFILDEAWRLSEESFGVIVPVLRDVDLKKEYITLAEAEDVEVKDTGDINYVYVKNNEDSPLLVSRGEIFSGKTQERAAMHGHIIMSGKGMRVAVRCVHASKGIQQGEYMHYYGRTPYRVTYNLSSQGKTWDSVQCFSASASGMGTSLGDSQWRQTSRDVESTCNGNFFQADSPLRSSMGIGSQREEPRHDDLAGTLSEVSAMMKEVFRKIPDIENQVGAIFIHNNSVLGLDIYDIPVSWSAVKKEVIEKEGSEFLSKDDTNLFMFDTSRVGKFLQSRLVDRTFEEKVIYGEEQGKPYKVVEIKEVTEKNEKGLMGEAVILHDRIIHLTMYRS